MLKVYAAAPELNVQPPMVVFDENDRLVVLDVPKDAVPVGTVPVPQLAPVLKSPEPGLASQVASCAAAGSAAASVTSADASSAAAKTGTGATSATALRTGRIGVSAAPIAGAVRLWGLVTWLAGLVAVILLWRRTYTDFFKGRIPA